MLEQAAVVVGGGEFDVELLAEVSGIPLHALADLLEQAVRGWVLIPARDGRGRYAFVHALMRDALYNELPIERRIRPHLRAGEAVARLGTDEDADVDQLAYHFLMAAPSGDLARAVEYARRAGQRALGRLGYEEAARYFGHALDALRALGDDGPRRIELLLALGDAKVRPATGRARWRRTNRPPPTPSGSAGHATWPVRRSASVRGWADSR